MQDNYYSQFKFQPKIDQMSKILSASTNLHELYKVKQLLIPRVWVFPTGVYMYVWRVHQG